MVTEYVRRSYHVNSPRDGRTDEDMYYREEVAFVPYVCVSSEKVCRSYTECACVFVPLMVLLVCY